MHFSETRLAGVLAAPLLLANRLAAATNRTVGIPPQSRFDSWVIACTSAS
jgi:hypothetical protein